MSQSAEGLTQRVHDVSIRVVVAGIAIIVTLGVGAALSLGTPRCPATEMVTFTGMTFGTTVGQVTFSLANEGTSSVTIVQADVSGGTATGVTTNVNDGNVIPPEGALSLTVIFPSVTFQSGTAYAFTLHSACGNHFPYTAVA